ncbi:ubiquitin carboxyl-terminal hydrolase 15-like [Suncus etruscus]|uniref:ubiquitin carboxyl-terminal hydrolase 15-like n=1 Tax=Suncus etruscus TaxID=109475 RepID=UPI00211028D7|nr:ubiquitin carboxyl-terminal hydrolase 15-like [Suncus etruscus]
MAESGAMELDIQRSDIVKLLNFALRKGDTWYLVASCWFKQWKKYVGFDNWDKYQMGDQNVYPGPIDNSVLLKDGDARSLKKHLIDELDYVLLPTKGWNKLVSWYTLMEGQEPIARKVVEHGMFIKHCKVEVYLTELKLCEYGNMNDVVTRRFSKADTIDTVEREIRKTFNIPDEKQIRLWNKYMSDTFEPLNKPDGTIQDNGLYQEQVLVIEQKNVDGTWPRDPSTPNVKNSKYSHPSYTAYKKSDYSEPGRNNEQPGLCGLSNLGNTCFMNSAIQCLSNIPSLTEYFLSDKYQEELNFDNPLGMGGEIAKSYAELIKQIWSGKFSSVKPTAFKTKVGRFAPQFSGYQQQDCQELLAFLIDGLHEDLNRIKKKTYIQLKDADGRPDKVVAEETWENHLKRNDSIIVDLFHGLFKSTLVCSECSKMSVTFDPFCYLTLPLSMKKEHSVNVYLVRMDPFTKPMQYKVVVPQTGNIQDLCTALSTLSGVLEDTMIVTAIYSHRFHRIFTVDENLSSIMERDDIYVFEININMTEDTKHAIIPVCLREKIRHSSSTNRTRYSYFGQPFLMAVPRDNTEDELYNILLLRMWRYVKIYTETEETEGSLHCCKDQSRGNGSTGIHEEGSPSEMETNKPDDESSQDQELLSENENRQSEDSVGGDSDSENGLGTEETCKGQLTGHKKRLFTFQFNNLLNTNINIKDDTRHIRFDDRQLELDKRSFLALDWDPDLKKRHFNENAAEEFEKHESMENKPPKKSFVELKDCIELFTTKEMLGAENHWYCSNCKENQQVTKKLDLWSLPPVLVIHLKRFSYSEHTREKLDILVDFPKSDLDMSEFLISPNAGPCRYNLIAVSNHYGVIGGGHYTAFAKNKDDGKWYYFDDTNVSTASEDKIVSKAAYLLFYQRQDTFSGTDFSPLDRETKDASDATCILTERDEDSNDNDTDRENENCMHTD